MNSILKKVICIAVIIHLSKISNAQIERDKYEIGISGGTFLYQGDISHSKWGSYHFLHPGLSIFGSKDLSSSFTARVNFSGGRLADDEANYFPQRGFAFTAAFQELSGLIEWYPLPFGNTSEVRFHPYIFAGGGVSFMQIIRDWSRFDTSSFPQGSSVSSGIGYDTLHALPNAVLVIPVGVGVKYRIATRLFITAEACYRFTSSDYIDGFSHAGNPATKDSYYGLSIGVRYRIAKSDVACPRKIL